LIDLHGDLIRGDRPPLAAERPIRTERRLMACGPIIAAAILTAMLAGCATAPRSVVSDNRYAPAADGPNMRIVRGEAVDQSPLVPEPGDIWAGIVPGGVPGLSGTANPSTKNLPTMRRGETSVPPAAGDQAKNVATMITLPDKPGSAGKLPAGQKMPSGAPPDEADTPLVDEVNVQLFAAPSQADARAAWTWLQDRLPKALKGHSPQVVPGQTDGQPIWRLLTGGFADQAAAATFCNQVRDVGAQCKVVNDGA
jgi:hypothetical protein